MKVSACYFSVTPAVAVATGYSWLILHSGELHGGCVGPAQDSGGQWDRDTATLAVVAVGLCSCLLNSKTQGRFLIAAFVLW